MPMSRQETNTLSPLKMACYRLRIQQLTLISTTLHPPIIPKTQPNPSATRLIQQLLPGTLAAMLVITIVDTDSGNPQ